MDITLCSATLSDEGRREPPLGPLYIAAALEEVGVDVDFRDFQLDTQASNLSGAQLAAFLEGHAEVVAISCFLDMLPAVIDAAQRLSRARPTTHILLGGPGPSGAARRILEEYPWIAAVVRGEGDEAVQDWVRLRRGELRGPIAGLIYRAGDTLVEGPQRPRTRALDELPLPAYHLLDWPSYTHARIITTRGCAYRCSFCDVAALWGNHSVYRGLDATLAELDLLRERYGKAKISVVDDTFVLNRDRVRAFCQLLIARGTAIEWGCFGRINLMDPTLMALMARAGCRAVFYGIDSGSPAVLERTAKRLRAEQVLPVLRASADYFQNVEASFIWGYPFERLADFEQTLALAAEACAFAPTVNVQLHLLSPLPMSPLYREFGSALIEPQPADRPWLLLPPLLLDEAASDVAALVRTAPDIYPGFFAFPSPDKAAKQHLLRRVTGTLERTIGATLLDARVARLLDEADPQLEHDLLSATTAPPERVGVGLALGFLSRTRHRSRSASGVHAWTA